MVLWKSYGKVVLNTEFGNKPLLSNYDPVKWRIATWVAFMNECGMLFWSMSGFLVPAGPNIKCNANAYIGPETRRSLRALNELTKDLPVDMKPVATGYTADVGVRAYALSNGAISMVYVHHFADHSQTIRQPMSFGVQTGPGEFRAQWFDPATGEAVAGEDITAEMDFLRLPIPPFKIDLICRLDRV